MRILYLDIDTLRPDHMSCYGYQRQTTPNLDLIAHEGVLFQNCYTSDAPCLPSRAALISGKFGILNGVTGHGGTAADRFLTGPARDFTDQADESNFFNIFRHAGFYTASISTFPERHSAWWFNAGLNEWINEGQRGGETAGQVGELARKWLIQQQDNDNWLLHVHLWDPHTPYRAPASFGNPFAADPLPAWIDQTRFEEHRRMTGPHGLQELQMYDSVSHPAFPRQPGSVSAFKDLRQVFDGYDCGVAYADQICGQIFRLLQAQGNWDDTAVI
ncbi:MAG: sulfatase, partial [Oscillospiraceae bacterium]|nr:sulfatase [Oscillospiraceae bacterium]